MLILIAESKTMREDPQTAASLPQATPEQLPAGEAQARTIMENLSGLSLDNLAAATGLSTTLSRKLKQMIYDFPDKSSGIQAIKAYTGVVFKALDYSSLSPEARMVCDRDVRIVSSLYGLLRPQDFIKPYRLDFTSKAAPGEIALNSFWKKDLTIQIVRTLRAGGFSELLNLLPADAAKGIDWKAVKRFCKVRKVDFVEIVDGGRTKTPSANKLKTMRGELLRQILTEGISDFAALGAIKSDTYLCEGTPVYPDHFQFLC